MSGRRASDNLRPGLLRAEKARIGDRFQSIDRHHRALDVAIEDNFADGFDERSWRAAFESDDPRDTNRCVVITGDFSAIVNSLTELLKTAAGKRLLGLVPFKRPPAEDVFVAVAEDGGITDVQRDVLHQLVRFEGRLEHLSPEVSAGEVFAAIELLRSELPELVKSIRSWLAGHGVDFP